MLNTVKLNHTVWYSNSKKIIRLDTTNFIDYSVGSKLLMNGQEVPTVVKIHSISKTVETIGSFPLEFMYYGPEGLTIDKSNRIVDSFEVTYNADKKCFDITILPNEKLNNDGEIKLTISYYIFRNGEESDYTEDHSSAYNKQYTLEVIIPFRSHTEETFGDPKYNPNYFDKLDIRNGFSHSPKPSEEPVVYTAELIRRDITDEFATYGDVKEMLSKLAASNGTGGSDYTLLLEGDTLVLTKTDDASYRREINLAKYHDEVSGQPVNVENIKQDILNTISQQIPNKENLKTELLDQVGSARFISKWLNNGAFTANDINGLLLNGPTEADGVTKTILNNYKIWQKHIKFVKKDDRYVVVFEEENMSPHTLLEIPFSSLRELPTATAGEPVTLEKILELVSDESKSEVISQLKSKLASAPLTAEQILDKATEAATDREKAGKLFQKLLDAETLNVVEKTDGYELSYTGDVNKVLVKIPKQAVTVSQEVLTAALTENVVTDVIKPTLDKSYYSKEEVDNLIKKLKEELTAEDHEVTHSEEHPQQ